MKVNTFYGFMQASQKNINSVWVLAHHFLSVNYMTTALLYE